MEGVVFILVVLMIALICKALRRAVLSSRTQGKWDEDQRLLEKIVKSSSDWSYQGEAITAHAKPSHPDITPANILRWQIKTGKPVVIVKGGGEYGQEVVGESFYAASFKKICGGRQVRYESHPAVLKAEPNNRYDKNAVGVYIDGLKVGHLPKAIAKKVQPALLSLGPGVEIGVEAAINGHDELYGVFLDLPLGDDRLEFDVIKPDEEGL